MNEKLLTTSSAARIIGKSEGHVRYAAAIGKLPVLRTTNGQRLFREQDVLEFCKQRTKKPTPSGA